MLCIYRSKANFAENMANNVKKRVKVPASRSEEHTSELQSPAMISYAVFHDVQLSIGQIGRASCRERVYVLV